jgi:hypothetical protein
MSILLKESLTQDKFEELISSDDKCLEFLMEIKWAHGFNCRKCGNTNYCEGKTPYSRRCTKCKSEESATRGTIFHNCKFPISKAFYIAFKVCRGTEEISTYEFARRLSLRQMTCWNFKAKIQNALGQMDSLSEQDKVTFRKILAGG